MRTIRNAWVFILLIAVILPAFIIIPQAFTSLNYFQFPIDQYSLKWFEKFFDNRQWTEGLGLSLFVAIFTAMLATTLGTMAAFAMNKFDFPFKNIFMSLMLAPMIVPVIITGVSLYTVFSRLGLTNNSLGLILSHTVLAIPMVFVTMLSGFANVDGNLELAAQSMGSTPLGAFFKVTLPAVKAPLASSILFSFVTSLDEVVVTIFISGANTKTLPMVMWENMRTSIDPTLAVAALFLIILTLGMYITKEVIEAKNSTPKS